MDPVLAVVYLLPFIILTAIIGRVDTRFILFVLWGCVAAIPAVLLEPVLFGAVSSEIPAAIAPLTISPLVEEFFKALPLLILAIGGSRQQDRDIFLYAMASGIGFAVIETGLLASPDPLAILIHSFSTALLHGCTCGMIGYGIVIAGHFDRRAFPALIMGFFTLAVTVHAIYNTLGTTFFGLAGICVDLVFPVLLFFALLACYHIDLPALFVHQSGS
ncbi:PrsW family glutamic-type intramembrane protease [Methanoregula sp.]|uniref:PrsW family glutamic-type intramembrane protease n=1 Tax=Methanoregula sp. TaxID=2052170 RepID=UPI002C7446C3|nr:PrsW family glutamic-type intramembrane protease [Methanoregula sp.]HVP97579.1 PrsW family glutamic-type intramembrane protease [Methanoregula sp.]